MHVQTAFPGDSSFYYHRRSDNEETLVRWVPRHVTLAQRRNRHNMSVENLILFEDDDPDSFFDNNF